MKTQDRSKQILTSLLTAALCYGSVASAQSRKTAPAKVKSAKVANSNLKAKTNSTATKNAKQSLSGVQVAANTQAAASTTSTNRIAPSTQTSVTQLPQPESLNADSRKRLTIISAMEYSQKIAVEDQGQRESSTDLVLALSYKTSDLTTMTARAVVSKENSGQKNTTVSNTQIILGIKGYTFNDHLSSAHSISGVIPTNEDSQKRDRLQTAVAISNGLTYVIPAIKIDYRLGLSKNFHEFNVNADGKANIEYSLSNTLAIDVPIIGGLHISASGVYRNARTYGGFERNSFAVSADLNYDFSDRLAMNIGTSNEGSALKSNGVDSNISVYDDKSSIVRAGLGYTY